MTKTDGEAKPSPKKGKKKSPGNRARSNITPPEGSEAVPASPAPRARAKAAGMRAQAIERVAAGEGVVAIARELGVSRKTVQRWMKSSGVAEKQELTMQQAVERGRKTLIDSAERAARRVVELVTQEILDKGEASGARVNLSAALEVLNRVGLHPRSEVDLGTNALTALFDKYGREPTT